MIKKTLEFEDGSKEIYYIATEKESCNCCQTIDTCETCQMSDSVLGPVGIQGDHGQVPKFDDVSEGFRTRPISRPDKTDSYAAYKRPKQTNPYKNGKSIASQLMALGYMSEKPSPSQCLLRGFLIWAFKGFKLNNTWEKKNGKSIRNSGK